MGRPPLHVGELSPITFDRPTKHGVRARARLRLRNGAMKQLSAMGPNKTTAADSLRAKAAHLLGAVSTDLTDNSTFTEVAEAWLERVKLDGRVTAATLSTYRKEVTLYVTPKIGALRMWEVSTGRIQEVVDEYAATSARKARVFKSLTAQVCKFACVKSALEHLPTAAVSLPRSKGRTVKTASLKDIQALRAAALNDLDSGRSGPKSCNTLLAIDLLIGTGGRIGEVAALKVGDFSPEAHTLRIHGHVTRVGNREEYVDGRKAGVVDQVVYLPDSLTASLLEATASRDPDEFILATRTGSMIQTNNLRRAIRRLERAAGVGPFTPHAFRRTVGTTIAHGLDSAAQAAAQLGNTEEVARAHYIRSKNIGPKEAADLLSPFFAPPEEKQRRD